MVTLWLISSRDYYMAIRRNGLWINPNEFILKGKSLAGNVAYCMIQPIEYLWTNITRE